MGLVEHPQLLDAGLVPAAVKSVSRKTERDRVDGLGEPLAEAGDVRVVTTGHLGVLRVADDAAAHATC